MLKILILEIWTSSAVTLKLFQMVLFSSPLTHLTVYLVEELNALHMLVKNISHMKCFSKCDLLHWDDDFLVNQLYASSLASFNSFIACFHSGTVVALAAA